MMCHLAMLERDGEIMERQRASTSSMVRPVAELVAFVSSYATLLPVDVILTGTPAGVGRIEPGDVVHVAIEQVGRLSNPVVSQDA